MWADVGGWGGGGKLRELRKDKCAISKRRTHRVCRVVPALEGREFEFRLYPELFIVCVFPHNAPHSGHMTDSFVLGNVALGGGDPS